LIPVQRYSEERGRRRVREREEIGEINHGEEREWRNDVEGGRERDRRKVRGRKILLSKQLILILPMTDEQNSTNLHVAKAQGTSMAYTDGKTSSQPDVGVGQFKIYFRTTR
jgi:hypothetical protein